MPDAIGHDAAVASLSMELTRRWPGAAEMAPMDLARRFPKRRALVRAWHLPRALLEAPHDVIVAVDKLFPWTLPTIALPVAPNGIGYPHVEADGQLCLVAASSSFAVPAGLEHVEQLVSDADALLQKGRTGENEADFYREAQSYWSLVSPTTTEFWLTEKAPIAHSIWSSASDGEHTVIAPDKARISSWAEAAGRKLLSPHPALMIRLANPLHPKAYPLTMRDLVNLIEGVGAGPLLQTAFSRWHGRSSLPVVLSFAFDGQDVPLGAQFQAPGTVRMPGAKRFGIPGFRHGARGRGLARKAALSIVPHRFPHHRVVPIYRGYLHQRTVGPAAIPFSNKRVVIAGCGALGGQVAVQLAQAGVGHLTLIDDDTLDWRNVGRHVLEGKDVGRNKALALADSIRRRLPDASVSSLQCNWETAILSHPSVFEKADLMVSLTGEAASNRHLDSLSLQEAVPAVVSGWLEPFGVATHAVFRHPAGGGLSDITDRFGLLCEPVSDRSTAPALPQEPSCGAFYQPYSSASALPGIALIVELVLDALASRQETSTHRVWVTGPAEFQGNSLSFTPSWHDRLNELGFYRRFDLPVPRTN